MYLRYIPASFFTCIRHMVISVLKPVLLFINLIPNIFGCSVFFTAVYLAIKAACYIPYFYENHNILLRWAFIIVDLLVINTLVVTSFQFADKIGKKTENWNCYAAKRFNDLDVLDDRFKDRLETSQVLPSGRSLSEVSSADNENWPHFFFKEQRHIDVFFNLFFTNAYVVCAQYIVIAGLLIYYFGKYTDIKLVIAAVIAVIELCRMLVPVVNNTRDIYSFDRDMFFMRLYLGKIAQEYNIGAKILYFASGVMLNICYILAVYYLVVFIQNIL